VEIPIQENRVKTLDGLVQKARNDAEAELAELIMGERDRLRKDLARQRAVVAEKMFAGIRENLTQLASLDAAHSVVAADRRNVWSTAGVLDGYLTIPPVADPRATMRHAAPLPEPTLPAA
jgi:hypothetical protein